MMNWITNDGAVVLILMSVTGSMLSVLWLIAVKFLRHTVNARVLYGVLKCVMSGYMIPVTYGAMIVQIILYGGSGGYLLMSTGVTTHIFRILLTAWVGGMSIFLLRQLQRLLQLHRICEGCMQAKQWQRDLLQELCEELHIRRKIELYQGYGVRVPFITGMIHGRIYLPVERFSAKELEVILRHELCHYKQGDLFWKPAFAIVCCIFWFNPLVWVTWQQMKQWAEASCDSRCCEYWVDAKQYFLFLCRMNEYAEGKMPDMVSAWFENSNELKWRVQCMKNGTRIRMKAWAVAGIFAVTIGCCGSTAYAAHAGVETLYGKVYQETVHDIDEPLDELQPLEEYVESAEEAFEGMTVVDMPDGHSSSRSSNAGSINWTVKNGYVAKSGSFTKKKGSTIDVMVIIEPSDKEVRVGIIMPNKDTRSVSGKDTISHSFEVTQTGTYQVYISNKSGSKIKATGTYRK